VEALKVIANMNKEMADHHSAVSAIDEAQQALQNLDGSDDS
jgi:hypothetical protein